MPLLLLRINLGQHILCVRIKLVRKKPRSFDGPILSETGPAATMGELGDTGGDTGGRGPVEDDVLGDKVVRVRVGVVREERGGGGFVAGTAPEGGRGAAGAGGMWWLLVLLGRAGVGHVPWARGAGRRHVRGDVGGRERGKGDQRRSIADVVRPRRLLAGGVALVVVVVVAVARPVVAANPAASSEHGNQSVGVDLIAGQMSAVHPPYPGRQHAPPMISSAIQCQIKKGPNRLIVKLANGGTNQSPSPP